MIKVGLFIDAYFPMVDGVINAVDNYAKRLNDEEFEVVVFCPKAEDKNYVDNFSYDIKRCKSVKIFFLDYSLPIPKFDKQFKKILKEQKLDIVHLHSPFSLARIAIKYARKNHIPVITTFHSQFKRDIKRSVKSNLITNLYLKHIMQVFNQSYECFTMNEFSKNLLIEYGCKRPITIIRNATDMKLEKPIEEYREIAYKHFKLKRGGELLLLYVGRINFLKNLEFIVNSLEKLPNNMKFKMVFVGDGLDKEKLELQIEKLGLKDKVLFTGKILDRELLKAIYSVADLFLIPSVYDTDAIVKIEASCFEVPSICLEGTGAGSVIKDWVNGFLIKENEEDLANLLIKLSATPDIIKRVGIQAKKDLYITWDEVVSELKKNYKRIITNYEK